MQIVIDIDDNLYTRLFDNGIDNYNDLVDIAIAIRKGTPLPKGHGRLIDADAEIKAMDEMKVSGTSFITAVNFCKIEMEKAQTIIEADKEVEE